MPKEEVVNFEALNLEDDNKGDKQGFQDKMTAHFKLLRTKLSPEDYNAVTKELGFKTEMTNEELLQAITALLKKPDEEEPKEKEPKEMASYKDFMTKCMKGGKDLKTCADEYKKQYPKAGEPTKEEQAEMEELAKKKPEEEYPGPEYKKKMGELEAELKKLQGSMTELTTKLTQEKNTAALATQVDKLIEEKHLAPAQREGLIKMAANMDPAGQAQMLEFFRTTQKMGGLFKDEGLQRNGAPAKSKELDDPAYRKRLLGEFHIDELIEDRGVKAVNKGGNN